MQYISGTATRTTALLTKLPQSSSTRSQRQLWQYLNIIFNRKDQARLKKFGPDRTCAEWILRNGGAVKISRQQGLLTDYNLLPPEGTPLVITAVDATGSSIMHYGFDHFVGCKQLDKIILNKCDYVYDQALKELQPLADQLRILQVTSCPNLTDDGLMHLTVMKALNTLTIGSLAGVKDIKGIGEKLKSALPNCNVTTG